MKMYLIRIQMETSLFIVFNLIIDLFKNIFFLRNGQFFTLNNLIFSYDNNRKREKISTNNDSKC